MQGDILMSGVYGYVASVNGGAGLVQAFGNFPRFDQRADSPGDFHPAVGAGFTFTGQFSFTGFPGFEVDDFVYFDIIEGPVLAGSTATQNYAANVRS